MREADDVPVEEIHHVQLAMPPGGEAAARSFYCDLLGLPETPKPPHLLRRGGCWFESETVKIHLGVEPDFRPAKKAHPALLVRDLTTLVQKMLAAGVDIVDDEPLAGYDRAYVYDPFGNRLELLEPRMQERHPPVPPDAARFVIVSGPPASGKTTLAPQLASALGLPVVAKDTIKDALISALGVRDVEESRRLGRAAVAAMLAVAAESPVGAVVESNFYRSRAAEQIRRLPGRVVEVFCRCSRDVAAERYAARTGTRSAGHFDHVRTADELWNDEVAEPVAGGWPVIEVDSNEPLQVDDVVAAVRAALQPGSSDQPMDPRKPPFE